MRGRVISPDSIPADIKTDIDDLFPKSEGRRRIAYTLMFWDRKLNTKEQEDLSRWAGFKGGGTTYKVLTKLKEIGLFTDKVGSIPLSRSLLDLEVEKEKEQMKTLSHTDVPLLPTPISAEETLKTPSVPPEGTSESPTGEGDPPPFSAQIDMKNRMKSAEDGIKQLERTTVAGFEDMKKILTEVVNPLSGAPTAENLSGSNPTEASQPDSQTDTLGDNPGLEVLSESLEDRLGRLETLVQEGGKKDPFADMSRDQILELLRSQPQEFMTLMNPDGAERTGRVQAQEVTLRPIILMLTTYSQMLYEKVVHDGFFEGTLSDFANFTMEQYFTDRGWSLDWNKREPASRRRFG